VVAVPLPGKPLAALIEGGKHHQCHRPDRKKDDYQYVIDVQAVHGRTS
jgi:hypothetical protein